MTSIWSNYGSVMLTSIQTCISTASQQHLHNRTFKIIHPFHPSQNKQFEINSIKTTPGERRVFYFNQEGRISSIPLEWTAVELQDPFVIVSAGRALFRVEDLLRLVSFFNDIKRGGKK